MSDIVKKLKDRSKKRRHLLAQQVGFVCSTIYTKDYLDCIQEGVLQDVHLIFKANSLVGLCLVRLVGLPDPTAHNNFGALILEHVSEVMADTCNISTHQNNK